MNAISTHTILEHYIDAFRADRYDTRLIPAEGLCRIPSRDLLEREDLLARYRHMRRKNEQGYHIFCRPKGYRYILLDDLDRLSVKKIFPYRPALIVETSPSNYQVWLILRDPPESRSTALKVCRAVCKAFEGDPASAEPDHLGRLPGYYNRKHKYYESLGYYPMTKMVYCKGQYTTYKPVIDRDNGNDHKNPSFYSAREMDTSPYLEHGFRMPVKKDGSVDESRVDIRIAMRMVYLGKSDPEIAAVLMNRRDKCRKRPDYVERTIRKAREYLGC